MSKRKLSPEYIVDVDIIHEDFIHSCRKLCGDYNGIVKEVVLGSEIEDLEIKENMPYSITRNLLCLHDDSNHVSIDIKNRSI